MEFADLFDVLIKAGPAGLLCVAVAWVLIKRRFRIKIEIGDKN